MKIIFNGSEVRYQGKGGKKKAGLPMKRVVWTAVVQLKDADGHATETNWSTPPDRRLNYLEAKATMFAVVAELQRVFREEYNREPDTAHFVMVSR